MTGNARTGDGDAAVSSDAQQGGDALGWVLLDPERVPGRWRSRGRQVVLVPLLGEEMSSVLTGSPAVAELDEIDEQLVDLAARGATVAQMAKVVGFSVRGVGHRLARLRDRFDAATTAELVAQLARRGFPFAETGNGLSGETEPPPENHADESADQ